jgi:hypothetical protein
MTFKKMLILPRIEGVGSAGWGTNLKTHLVNFDRDVTCNVSTLAVYFYTVRGARLFND